MHVEHTPARVREGEFEVDTDRSRLSLDVVHGFLSTSYWSPGIAREVVQRAMSGSICFGIYHIPAAEVPERPTHVGFARVITDGATFSYLADVFVLEAFRGRGLGQLLMRAVMSHPDLQGLRRRMLITRDAHGLYERFGFAPCARPDLVMELVEPNAGKRGAG